MARISAATDGGAMLDHLVEMVQSEAYMPHGMCFLWQPGLLWLHAGSDAVIALSYYSIPVALLYFVFRRHDLVFPTMFLLFGCFILACGTTHVMAIWTIWHPDYWLDGGIKAFTALVSLLTALLLWRVMPSALALPSRAALEDANRTLAVEVAERSRAEEEVRWLNQDLERRVAERTRELECINQDLRAALRDKDVLLDEIRHRVKNNLQIVSGLLSLQARSAPEAAVLPLQEAQERIRAMSRAHDQLYRSAEAETFEVDRLVRDVCEDLGHLYARGGDEVRLELEVVDPVRLPVDVATPLSLIVNEAVANAYKHAFPTGRAGRITVTLSATEDGARIQVRDDGVGLARDEEGRAGRLMGMRLIRLLAAQIKSAASWHSDGGTVFRLDLPAARGS